MVWPKTEVEILFKRDRNLEIKYRYSSIYFRSLTVMKHVKAIGSYFSFTCKELTGGLKNPIPYRVDINSINCGMALNNSSLLQIHFFNIYLKY